MENIVIFSKISDIFDIYRICINILIYIEYLSDACTVQRYIQKFKFLCNVVCCNNESSIK